MCMPAGDERTKAGGGRRRSAAASWTVAHSCLGEGASSRRPGCPSGILVTVLDSREDRVKAIQAHPDRQPHPDADDYKLLKYCPWTRFDRKDTLWPPC